MGPIPALRFETTPPALARDGIHLQPLARRAGFTADGTAGSGSQGRTRERCVEEHRHDVNVLRLLGIEADRLGDLGHFFAVRDGLQRLRNSAAEKLAPLGRPRGFPVWPTEKRYGLPCPKRPPESRP